MCTAKVRHPLSYALFIKLYKSQCATLQQLIFVPASCQQDTVSKQRPTDWQSFHSTESSKVSSNWMQNQLT